MRPGARAVLAALTITGVLATACAGPPPEPEAPAPQAAPPGRTDHPIPPGAIFVATHGNDAANGSETTPLRTLRTALQRVRPDGAVVVRRGTYRESVGLVRTRVTIRSYPGEEVWFKGSQVVTDWARSGAVWRHRGWSPELCRTCFEDGIIDPAYPLAGLPDMVFVDGRALQQVGSAREVGAGMFFVDVDREELLIGDDPAGRLVEATAWPWLLQFDGPTAAHSALRGIGVAQYGSHQKYGQRGAMVVVNAPSVTVEGNTFAASAASGLAVFQPDAVLERNQLIGNGLVGLVANRADRIRLHGNSFVRNNIEHFALTGEAIGAAGAKITRTRRPHVADNTFADNIGTGWWCDLGCTDAVVVRNIARGNAVNGLYYEVSSRAIIASNLVIANGAHGVKISSSDRVQLYHTTLVDNAIPIGLYNDKRHPSSDEYSEQLGLSWITSGTVLVNNVLVGRAGAPTLVESADHKPHPRPRERFVSTSDGNALLRDRDGVLAVWSVGSGRVVSVSTLDELRRVSGDDARSLTGRSRPTPFRDPTRGDYRLRESAPGHRAGRAVPPHIAAAIGIAPVEHPDMGFLLGPRE